MSVRTNINVSVFPQSTELTQAFRVNVRIGANGNGNQVYRRKVWQVNLELGRGSLLTIKPGQELSCLLSSFETLDMNFISQGPTLIGCGGLTLKVLHSLGGGLSAGLKSPDPANHSEEGLLSCHVCQNMHLSRHQNIIMFQFSSVTQSCPTLCDPMNHSMPGLPVHHQLLEFTQTHVHRVGDAIQPSHSLSFPFPPAPNPSQHESLFQWVNFLRITGFQLWCFTEHSLKTTTKKTHWSRLECILYTSRKFSRQINCRSALIVYTHE